MPEGDPYCHFLTCKNILLSKFNSVFVAILNHFIKGSSASTENQELLRWHFDHYWKKPLVPSVMTKLASWQLLVFSDILFYTPHQWQRCYIDDISSPEKCSLALTGKLWFVFVDIFMKLTVLWWDATVPDSMGPTWGPPGADRTQVGPMLAPWTLLSGMLKSRSSTVALRPKFLHYQMSLRFNQCGFEDLCFLG